ncbi:MAG: YqgE/AlgH family protein [Verrucomicrobia bacterium]|nr:YqgE/AlgH family protein [Verrucomicrobiota bacterium]
MEATPYSHLEKGTFLISAPEVQEGIFFRAVVLLCEHGPGGSFGLIVNKPLELELLDEILSVEEVVNNNIELRASGPVQTNQMMILHTIPDIPEQTIEMLPGCYLGGDLAFLQQCLLNSESPPLRLCFGYSGWGAGQLEREFLDGGWHLCRASGSYLFEVPAERLWQKLLRDMGGKYASLSMIPEDLSVN